MSISIEPNIVFNVGKQVQATLYTVVAIPIVAAFQVVVSSEKHPPEKLEDHAEQASMCSVCSGSSGRMQILSFSMSDSYHTSRCLIAFLSLSSAQRGQEVQLLDFADFPNPGLTGLSLSKCWLMVIKVWSSQVVKPWLEVPKCLLWFRILHKWFIKHHFSIVSYNLSMWATPVWLCCDILFRSLDLTLLDSCWTRFQQYINSLKWAFAPAAVYKGNAPVSGS